MPGFPRYGHICRLHVYAKLLIQEIFVQPALWYDNAMYCLAETKILISIDMQGRGKVIYSMDALSHIPRKKSAGLSYWDPVYKATIDECWYLSNIKSNLIRGKIFV